MYNIYIYIAYIYIYYIYIYIYIYTYNIPMTQHSVCAVTLIPQDHIPSQLLLHGNSPLGAFLERWAGVDRTKMGPFGRDQNGPITSTHCDLVETCVVYGGKMLLFYCDLSMDDVIVFNIGWTCFKSPAVLGHNRMLMEQGIDQIWKRY